MARRTARGYCSSISTRPVHIFTGTSITMHSPSLIKHVGLMSHIMFPCTHGFQQKDYCLSTGPQREVCKPCEVVLLYQWCEYYPSACVPFAWSRTMCLLKWASVYLIWRGEALAWDWPTAPGQPLINRPDLGDTRNAEKAVCNNGSLARESDQMSAWVPSSIYCY